MIKQFQLENCGPIKKVEWENLAPINVIIGENDTGKTLLLKTLYVLARSLQEYGLGDDNRDYKEVLEDKSYWTFQVSDSGELIRHGNAKPLTVNASINEEEVGFSIFADTEKYIDDFLAPKHKSTNTKILFIPCRDVLSISPIIKQSRNQFRQFGFDDTYLDLINTIEVPLSKDTGLYTASKALIHFSDLKGEINFENGEWVFYKGEGSSVGPNTTLQRIPINIAAEGIKKSFLLKHLITHYFRLVGKVDYRKTILFIDEPEANLHPEAIIRLLDGLAALAEDGAQIILATHSYFVINKLYLIAEKASIERKEELANIPVLSLQKDGTNSIENLLDNISHNSITETSIQLYEEELELSKYD